VYGRGNGEWDEIRREGTGKGGMQGKKRGPGYSRGFAGEMASNQSAVGAG